MNPSIHKSLVSLGSLFLCAAPLAASPIYPSSDLRVQDATGNGHGDHSHAEDATHEALNVGDNEQNHVWRSIIKFNLADHAEAIQAAEKIVFQATVRSRLIQVPKDWNFQVLSFPSQHAEMVLISPSGGREDDFSTGGNILHNAPSGTLKSGEQFQIDVTEAAKAAVASGVLALRLQLDPPTNNDNQQDQASFFAGSHEVNSPHLRPQLILNP